MKDITIFDKPMCCSSGVCGPSVDPVLVRFAEDLRWLEQQGVKVTRHNPTQDAHAFVLDPVVREAMKDQGEEVLPVGLASPANTQVSQDDDAPCCGPGCCG
jgi:hypothetical protein